MYITNVINLVQVRL